MKLMRQDISGKTVLLGAAGAAGVMVLVILVFLWRGGRGLDDPGQRSRVRVAIDAQTGDVFERFKIKDGDSLPWKHPRTGERTLYPAEKCFWAKDGSFSESPTYVLLNERVGKPGPTICPDCGRVVVARNPLPPFPGDEPASRRDRLERRDTGG